MFAPMYPQLTLNAIFTPGGITPTGAAIAYGGVLSAFQEYLKCCNGGRGIVFIGHSQGSSLLVALLARQVDTKPEVRRLMVSALLAGTNVTVPKGKRVGGSFTKIPACASARETGCVVSYASFDETPPADSRFGRVGSSVNPFEPAKPGLQVLCVNPAAPGGGSATLQPYFRATPAAAPTPWITYPGLYKARCTSRGGATWLQIDHRTRTGDERPVVAPPQGPQWGLHIFDVNLAAGNLAGLVARQAAAFAARR